VRLAITCFTATGLETKVVSGPEPFEAAKDKLRAAMRDGHADGVYEIWTSDGISDRFVFKGSPVAIDSAPAAEDGGSIPPDSTPAPEPEPEPTDGFSKFGKRRR
jgi:hypothetical protein